MYGAGALVCLLCGMAYLNNLAYLLCFFLISLFIIGMHQSNNNLKDISIEKIVIPVIPAHTQSVAQVWLKSKSSFDHHSLKLEALLTPDLSGQRSQSHLSGLRHQKDQAKLRTHFAKIFSKALKKNQSPFFRAWRKKLDSLHGPLPVLKARSQNIYNITIQPGARGRSHIKRIKLSSRYPFGLFYVWRYYSWDQEVVAHPVPEPNERPPLFIETGDEAHQPDSLSGHDFREHRSYQKGDSYKHIDWKALARGRPLMVKTFEEGWEGHYHLNMPAESATPEKVLSQLTHWVFHWSTQNQPFSLKAGLFSISPGLGWEHQQKALEALALWEAPEP